MFVPRLRPLTKSSWDTKIPPATNTPPLGAYENVPQYEQHCFRRIGGTKCPMFRMLTNANPYKMIPRNLRDPGFQAFSIISSYFTIHCDFYLILYAF